MKKQKKIVKRKKIDAMRLICWGVIPVITSGLLVADAPGVYQFTHENLIVIGVCLAVILLPFFSEIKVKDLSVKRNRSGSDKGT